MMDYMIEAIAGQSADIIDLISMTGCDKVYLVWCMAAMTPSGLGIGGRCGGRRQGSTHVPRRRHLDRRLLAGRVIRRGLEIGREHVLPCPLPPPGRDIFQRPYLLSGSAPCSRVDLLSPDDGEVDNAVSYLCRSEFDEQGLKRRTSETMSDITRSHSGANGARALRETAMSK